MRTILLIMVGLSSFLSADFTKSENIVSDSITGLEWQDNNEGSGTKRTWQEAIDYCESLSLNSHDDWRLPNVNELKSILDRSKREPSIVDGFEYVKSNFYWSSTSVFGVVYLGWVVSFYSGSVYAQSYKESRNRYVRCVRDGQ